MRIGLCEPERRIRGLPFLMRGVKIRQLKTGRRGNRDDFRDVPFLSIGWLGVFAIILMGICLYIPIFDLEGIPRLGFLLCLYCGDFFSEAENSGTNYYRV